MRFPLRRAHDTEPDDERPAGPAAAVTADPAPAESTTLPPVLNGHPLRHRPFKGQATGSDARAERMIRTVKGEIEELRRTIDVIGAGQEEIIEVSPAAVAENPSVAATLAPVVLVRSLVTAARTQERLERAVAEREEELNRLRAELSRLREEHAHQSGRLQTLDQVIAALHDNLEDLRGERSYRFHQLRGDDERPRLSEGREEHPSAEL